MMRLLESKRDTKKGRSASGTISSIILHVAIIFLAVFATARAGSRKHERVKAENVKFVAIKKEPPPPPKEPPPPPPERAGSRAGGGGPEALQSRRRAASPPIRHDERVAGVEPAYTERRRRWRNRVRRMPFQAAR